MDKNKTKAYVLHAHLDTLEQIRNPESQLEEAIALSHAINLDIALTKMIHLKKPTAATYIGSGSVEEIALQVKEHDIDLVVMNTSLSPIQQRNLERKWKTKVIDRTGLILEIFGERATTSEGSLQVELAALLFQRSRLVRSWTHLERQRGGFGFTGGPGETQIELDRRLIDERIIKIKKKLETVKRTRALHRKTRKDVPYPTVALVGYTNAGKSTLFNALTKADVFAKDLLFATLDPVLRQIKLPHGQTILLSDTVGFISDLPTQLVAAFRATLEEVCEADLILHVRDISHSESKQQKKDVEDVLCELGLEEKIVQKDMIEVLNKIDLLESQEKNFIVNIARNEINVVPLSAVTGDGAGFLLQKIESFLQKDKQPCTLIFSTVEGAFLSWCYRQGIIVDRSDIDDMIHLSVKLTVEQLDYIKSIQNIEVKHTRSTRERHV